MLQKFLALILMASIGIHTFQQVGIVANYYVNKAAFEKRCENRLKPLLQCHGKCLLMKKLIAEERKHQKYPELKFDSKIEHYVSPSITELLPSDWVSSVPLLYYIDTDEVADHISDIFHPPSATTPSRIR